jgi:hypothetical protein
MLRFQLLRSKYQKAIYGWHRDRSSLIIEQIFYFGKV